MSIAPSSSSLVLLAWPVSAPAQRDHKTADSADYTNRNQAKPSQVGFLPPQGLERQPEWRLCRQRP